MPEIDSGPIQEVIAALVADATILAFVARDRNNNPVIRPGKYNANAGKFPMITVEWMDGESNSKFPASFDTCIITAYMNQDADQPYKTLDGIKDAIVLLFNRKGEQFNDIDIPTNTGVRFNQFKKNSAECDYDETIKKYYAEVVFEVVVSENESFAPSDAGNQTWV